MYTVKDFLEKNKDHQQDMLFDFMENSSISFVKDITRYRVSKLYLQVCVCVCVFVCVCPCVCVSMCVLCMHMCMCII